MYLLSNNQKSKMKQIFHKINVSRHIANHLVGEDHTDTHRQAVGAVIMTGGIIFMHTLDSIDLVVVKIIGEVVGCSIHGIGLMPFIMKMEQHRRHEKEKEE